MSATAREHVWPLALLAALLLAFGFPKPAEGQDISLFLSLTQEGDLPCFTGSQESAVGDPPDKVSFHDIALRYEHKSATKLQYT